MSKKRKRLKKLDIEAIALTGSPATGINFFFRKSDDDNAADGFSLVDETVEGTPEQVAEMVAAEALALAEAN